MYARNTLACESSNWKLLLYLKRISGIPRRTIKVPSNFIQFQNKQCEHALNPQTKLDKTHYNVLV